MIGQRRTRTRRCVGWAMGESPATTPPMAGLNMALTQRRPPRGLLYHLDRGVQYASAAMESFWSSLKRELVHRRRFATSAQAHAAIFEWIEVFYDRERFHSDLGYKSPVDFENQLN